MVVWLHEATDGTVGEPEYLIEMGIILWEHLTHC